MVDPRIYRAFIIVVAFALIVFGFSLSAEPQSLGTTIAPGQFFAGAGATTQSLQRTYPDRAPGSAVDRQLAGAVAAQLRAAGGFSVSTREFSAATSTGSRTVEEVVASRQGLGSGTVVVVSHRDAAGPAAPVDLSGTTVLLGLARALSSETLARSVVLVSTAGQAGLSGATQLARSLSGQPVDAVILLGDLGSATVRDPIVVPWSSTDRLAPVQLTRTLGSFVAAQTGIVNRNAGLGGQLARLAFPFALTEQAPFVSAGLPAALLSLSGDRPLQARPATTQPTRVAGLGAAVLQTVNALDHGPSVGLPGAYLLIKGQTVPLWAVRLLVLALILPAAASTLDAVARARRRGHALVRWLGWVLAGAVPFVAGLIALLLARAAGALSFTPPGAAAGAGAPHTGADLVVLLVVLAVVVVGFVLLRPFCLRRLAEQLPGGSRPPQSPAADAAAVALNAVLCALALLVWLVNPFEALLLVPALHTWLWLAQPGARGRRWSVGLLLLVGIVPIGLILFYYANAYALSPLALAWSLALLPGGAMPIGTALGWAIALGCAASATIIGLRAARATGVAAEQPVTVRGPASYAGPGSLGGTQSALRR